MGKLHLTYCHRKHVTRGERRTAAMNGTLESLEKLGFGQCVCVCVTMVKYQASRFSIDVPVVRRPVLFGCWITKSRFHA